MIRVTTLMGTEIAGRAMLDLDEANMFHNHKRGSMRRKSERVL